MGMMTAPSDLDYRTEMFIDRCAEQEVEHCPRCHEAIEDCACGYCLDANEVCE